MDLSGIVPYIILAILLLSFLFRYIEIRVAVAELKDEFFPQLISDLKALEKRLSEEEVGDEGYVELLGRKWKSTLTTNLHRYYRREEKMLVDIKQDLEECEKEVREWKVTGDDRRRENIAERKMRIRENLTQLIKELEKLM